MAARALNMISFVQWVRPYGALDYDSDEFLGSWPKITDLNWGGGFAPLIDTQS